MQREVLARAVMVHSSTQFNTGEYEQPLDQPATSQSAFQLPWEYSVHANQQVR